MTVAGFGAQAEKKCGSQINFYQYLEGCAGSPALYQEAAASFWGLSTVPEALKIAAFMKKTPCINI